MMENKELLNDEALENVVGGCAAPGFPYPDSTGQWWYTVAPGDTLRIIGRRTGCFAVDVRNCNEDLANVDLDEVLKCDKVKLPYRSRKYQ